MSSAEPVAWVLNLDAEDELARGGAHTPTAVMTARIQSLIPRLSSALTPTLSPAGERERGLILRGDRVLWPGEGTVPPGMQGRAWCPTRWALTQMERAQLRLPRAPSVDVLRRVNHRRFAHDLGQALPVAGFATSANELTALLSAPLERFSEERCWLIKRPLGYAGRGRRKLRAGELSTADQSWLEASLRTGDGLQVEPWVHRELDCALHGWLGEDGSCVFGQPTLQEVDATGAWQSTVVAPGGSIHPGELEQLSQEAHRTADALRAAGYFGPFGLDAFRWRSPDGDLHFQPRSEVNARYSMGWAVGMGGFRPAS